MTSDAPTRRQYRRLAERDQLQLHVLGNVAVDGGQGGMQLGVDEFYGIRTHGFVVDVHLDLEKRSRAPWHQQLHETGFCVHLPSPVLPQAPPSLLRRKNKRRSSFVPFCARSNYTCFHLRKTLLHNGRLYCIGDGRCEREGEAKRERRRRCLRTPPRDDTIINNVSN